MRHLSYLFILTTLLVNTSFTTLEPLNPIPIIKSAGVTVALFEEEQRSLFRKANYNAEQGNLEFITHGEIKYLRIYRPNGKLMYQLPVMSHKVRISKKMFKPGKYLVGFKLNNSKEIQFTEITIA